MVGSALPAPQWGSGSSLINTARQVGAALGVAVLVSIIGSRTTGQPEDLPLIRDGWIWLVATGAAAALLGATLAVSTRRSARAGQAPRAEPVAGPLGDAA